MAATYKQGKRQMLVTTPLPADSLLLVGFTGSEQLSSLYRFSLDLIAKNTTKIEFDKVLGKDLGVTMVIDIGGGGNTTPPERYFRGICSRFSQGQREGEFTHFRAEVVPPLWLTTRIAQSRIFQHMSVPDILKKVLSGLSPTFNLTGTYQPRNYCVQYRETDFNFVSRLMEEEGIFYFFKHGKSTLEMVVADAVNVHPDVPGATKVQWDVEAGARGDVAHIHDWEKVQEIRSGKICLWDYCFELPNSNLEATKPIMQTLEVGKVAHKMVVGGNDRMEIYDYPGEFAQRFDGINKGGGEQASEVSKISPDGTRTAGLRMQAETVAGLVVQGSSNCNQFTSGHKFTLDKHFDAEGSYVLTGVHHSARQGNAYRSSDEDSFEYTNSFTCIPLALPFRPQRYTPKPSIPGVQTAVVVGPPGEEIFTDKYGRVKVQFPWDRQSTADADSSCWLRVGTPWAGKNWGSIHIPRVGQEVIVQFLEGDPDAPIIVGSVYNANTMPPYTLPDEKTKSTLKSNSSKNGGGFNEIRFEDKKGSEQIFIHAQKQRDLRVTADNLEYIGENEHLIVVKDRHKQIQGDEHFELTGCRNEEIGETVSLKIGQDLRQKAGMNVAMEAGIESHFKAGVNVVIEAGAMITLKAGPSFITVGPAGVAISGPTVMINSGGSAGSGGGCSPTPPVVAKEAATASAGSKEQAAKKRTHQDQSAKSPTATALASAAESGAPFVAVVG